MKPIIGVIPLWDEKKDSIWMLPGYLTAVMQAGGCPVILPFSNDDDLINQFAVKFDGFLFTGGHDVSPALYNEKKSKHCGFVYELRDKMESKLFYTLMNMDKPIFGICRGIQLFNVLLGGSLYQDLPTEYSQSVSHEQKPPYDEPAHCVDIAQNTPLEDLLKVNSLQVNSYHHQAIKSLSSKLAVMATSEDGLVEAVYMPEKRFVWAVQWHPELSLNENSSKALLSAFVKACTQI